jgi:hypothetical protein
MIEREERGLFVEPGKGDTEDHDGVSLAKRADEINGGEGRFLGDDQ